MSLFVTLWYLHYYEFLAGNKMDDKESEASAIAPHPLFGRIEGAAFLLILLKRSQCKWWKATKGRL